jgi:hypothetical protein
MGGSANAAQNPSDDDQDVPMVLGIRAMPVKTATAAAGRTTQLFDRDIEKACSCSNLRR